MTIRAAILFLMVFLIMTAGSARGFTLLDYRIPSEVQQLAWFDWVNPRNNVARCPGGRGVPFTLSYRVDANFMANQPAAVRAGALDAVRNALQTWSDASGGFVTFREAPWNAVPNVDRCPTPASCPGFPCTNDQRFFFDGPSQAEFIACTTGCANCWPGFCDQQILPGWGANIDIFSRPVGFRICSNGFPSTMTSNLLGFAVVHRTGGQGIASIDLYLNESVNWTNSATTAARFPIGKRFPICPCPNHAAELTPAELDELAGSQAFDIETVVLHELGHALGLDHPNEACSRSAAQIDPFTYAFQSCGQFDSSAVMIGSYAGVKRSLTADDIGGLSFLYRPQLWGDLEPDNRIDILDAAAALDLLNSDTAPTPYQVNTMDFRTRNGEIDLDEVAQVVDWALNPTAAPFVSDEPVQDPKLSTPPPATTITLSAIATPSIVGLSATISVDLRIANAGNVNLTGWDIDIVYNTAVFSNPRISNGTLLPTGGWASTGPDDGNIRFARLGVGTSDNSASGSLGLITFDVNLQAAAAGPALLSFQFNDVQLVADQPYIHLYSRDVMLPETLNVQNLAVSSFRFDGTGDGVVNLHDLYQFNLAPYDVNRDTIADESDRMMLQNAIRSREPEDLIGQN